MNERFVAVSTVTGSTICGCFSGGHNYRLWAWRCYETASAA